MTPFPFRIVVSWSDEDGAYVARVPSLPGAGGDGESEAVAIEGAKASAAAIIDVLRKHGDPIPLSDIQERKFSGQLRLRLPVSLHRRLSEEAEYEGVSLNQLMVTHLYSAATHARQSVPRVLNVGSPVARANFIVNGTRVPMPTGSASDSISYHVPHLAKMYEH